MTNGNIQKKATAASAAAQKLVAHETTAYTAPKAACTSSNVPLNDLSQKPLDLASSKRFHYWNVALFQGNETMPVKMTFCFAANRPTFFWKQLFYVLFSSKI
jgi:hypothetical protein